MRPNTHAKRRARAAADEFYDEGRDRAGEAVRDALLSDEMFCWLVQAADLAGDYSHARWQELDDRDVPEDDLRALLDAAELQLADAASEREDQLVAEALAEIEVDDDE
jgi:IS5 family transposase